MLSNEEILSQFNEAYKSKEFNNYNTTSINHFFLGASGLNGDEVRIVALKILDDFLVYLQSQSDKYIFDYNKLYNRNTLKKCIDWLKTYRFINKEQALKDLNNNVFDCFQPAHKYNLIVLGSIILLPIIVYRCLFY